MACEDCKDANNRDCTEVYNEGHRAGTELEHGFKKFWRPIAAYIYLFICVVDFVGMPIYIEINNTHVNQEAFEAVRTLKDTNVKLKALEQLDLGTRNWTPLTLQGGAFFHLSFGAILGVSAFTRGKEKQSAIER